MRCIKALYGLNWEWWKCTCMVCVCKRIIDPMLLWLLQYYIFFCFKIMSTVMYILCIILSLATIFVRLWFKGIYFSLAIYFNVFHIVGVEEVSKYLSSVITTFSQSHALKLRLRLLAVANINRLFMVFRYMCITAWNHRYSQEDIYFIWLLCMS